MNDFRKERSENIAVTRQTSIKSIAEKSKVSIYKILCYKHINIPFYAPNN